MIQAEPDLLVVADKFRQFVWPEEGNPGIPTINPGPFIANSKRVVVYRPHSNTAEIVEISG
jgi:hypothetical protein